jgi:hypothetical protein
VSDGVNKKNRNAFVRILFRNKQSSKLFSEADIPFCKGSKAPKSKTVQTSI